MGFHLNSNRIVLDMLVAANNPWGMLKGHVPLWQMDLTSINPRKQACKVSSWRQLNSTPPRSRQQAQKHEQRFL